MYEKFSFGLFMTRQKNYNNLAMRPCLNELLAIWWIRFGFGSCNWETKKIYRQVRFIENYFFLEKNDFCHFFDSHDCMKILLNT